MVRSEYSLDDVKIIKTIFDFFALANKTINEDINIVEMAFEEEVQDDVINSTVSDKKIIESDISSLRSKSSKKRKPTTDKKKSKKIKEKLNQKNQIDQNANKNKNHIHHYFERECYLLAFNLLSKMLTIPSKKFKKI